MKKRLLFFVMLVGVLVLGFAQTALSGTYRYSANAYITFTGNNFTGSWNRTSTMSGTYSVSGTRLTLNITGGTVGRNTWNWTIVDANTLRDQDGDNWRKEGGGSQSGSNTTSINITVANTAQWNAALQQIRNGGDNRNYVITVNGNVSVPGIASGVENDSTGFGRVENLTVTINGNGRLSLTGQGGILYVSQGQTFIIDSPNLTLQGHSRNEEPLVSVMTGVLQLKNGSISGNSAQGGGGGVNVVGNGTFNMSGGTISGNTTTSLDLSGYILHGYGGGVDVSGSTFNMSGGTISGNTAQDGGGGVNVGGGTFNMSGGTISGNNTQKSGGGVTVIRESTFTMSGGTISGNSAQVGGSGVAVVNNSTLIMSGGTISGNRASTNGGGVAIVGSIFTKTGGTIYGANEGSNTNNIGTNRIGNAVLWTDGSNVTRYRNATLGVNDNISTSNPSAGWTRL